VNEQEFIVLVRSIIEEKDEELGRETPDGMAEEMAAFIKEGAPWINLDNFNSLEEILLLRKELVKAIVTFRIKKE